MGGHPDDRVGRIPIPVSENKRPRTGHQSEATFSPSFNKAIAARYKTALDAANVPYSTTEVDNSVTFHFGKETLRAKNALNTMREAFAPQRVNLQ